MRFPTMPARCDRRRTPLAAWVAWVLALASPAAMASTTWTVNTCVDDPSGSGTSGSLRYAAAGAASGDTIDMSSLTCSTISLLTGALTLNQNSLTLKGPGAAKLSIQGSAQMPDRVIYHDGRGSLYINDVSLAMGSRYSANGSAYGGCLFSSGAVQLNHVVVQSCVANAPNLVASGGAVFIKANLELFYSTIKDSTAEGLLANGGGALVSGELVASYSSIQGNLATGSSAFGGGLATYGDVTISNSTISGNSSISSKSEGDAGGIQSIGSGGAPVVTIVNSTIYGNHASQFVGGIYCHGPMTLENSTVAGNTAGAANGPFFTFAAGLAIAGEYDGTVTLQSSIIANNTYASTALDFSVITGGGAPVIGVAGSSNLIKTHPVATPVPAGTLTGNPLLGPLQNNGGLTLTQALMSGSPALGTGNNGAGTLYDQRGSQHWRAVSGKVDIGALQAQPADRIFAYGFDAG
jgi:hypothetical protein